MEVNRKREVELQKLQHEVEELQMQNETQLSAFRKKHQEVQGEFAEQVDQLNKLRQRLYRRIMGATTGGSRGSRPPQNLDGPPTFYIAF